MRLAETYAASSVIGPLVVCCATCKRENEKLLRKYASKDSKQLTAAQREAAYAKLKEFCTFRWVEVSAADLNELMPTMSLNDIEAKVMAGLIKNLQDEDVMIDMPDRYSWTFRKRMGRFGADRFEAEHKADEKYPIVAAASICAKVTRDSKVAEIRKATCDFGSGYPSDEKTVAALKDRVQMQLVKPFVRVRWKTLDNLKQRKLFDGDGIGGVSDASAEGDGGVTTGIV